MSLYTKGTWRRYHVEPEALQQCCAKIWNDPRALFTCSALAGRATLVTGGEKVESSIGINPPDQPRIDCGLLVDQDDIDGYLLPHLGANLKDERNMEPWVLPEGAEMPDNVAELANSGWGKSPSSYRLFNKTAGVIGFWLVSWGRQDLVDKPSMREDRAASMTGMPYKLLSNEMKKELFGEEKEWEVTITRKQVPVIIDMTSGDIWLGSGSTKFAKALGTILHLGGLMLTPGELVMGNSRGWLRLALNLVRDKDLYKLERAEAITRALAAEQAETFEPVDDGEGETPVDKEAQKLAMEDMRYLAELGSWAPDEGGETLVLLAEASVALSPDATSSVATVSGRDALELFVAHPNAELVACSGTITLPPPPMDDKGELARITVDFTAELVSGIYRNLEFCGMRSLWNELLEEPWIRDTSMASVVDADVVGRGHAPRYNRYWFRYYLMLKEFEQRMIHGFARVLDLDPAQVSVQSRSLFTKPVPVDPVQEAAQQMADTFKANLREGESVTFVGGGHKTTIHGTAKAEDFMEDIPFAVDGE